jgi:hypothetical protein
MSLTTIGSSPAPAQLKGKNLHTITMSIKSLRSVLNTTKESKLSWRAVASLASLMHTRGPIKTRTSFGPHIPSDQGLCEAGIHLMGTLLGRMDMVYRHLILIMRRLTVLPPITETIDSRVHLTRSLMATLVLLSTMEVLRIRGLLPLHITALTCSILLQVEDATKM